jgi:hypothetical protein
MKKLLLILLFIPLLGKSQSLHKIFKYSTVYAAINGGTSLGDNQIFSITSGALEEDIIKTPFDYTFSVGIRKIKRFGYENRALTFYIKYFEASQRYRKQIRDGKLSFNGGLVQRLAEPYGFDPLADWVLDNGTLHYTYLALQEGYNITMEGEYFSPNGELVANSQEVWEEVVIPEVINNYVEKQRNSIKNIVEYSFVLGLDYYHFTNDFWFHSWANLMPYHINTKNTYSYHKYNDGQWVDYSGGLIFGYWNRTWHNFSVGLNYVIF